MSQESADSPVVLGKISGLYGVRGWVKIYSHTQPREGILNYSPWLVKRAQGWQPMRLSSGKVHGKGIVASLEGITDRNQAELLLGAEIAVLREQLPQLQDGEVYWRDLIGLQVETVDGLLLGKVDHLFETGANDVLVVEGERERLIPWIREQVIVEIDLQAGRIRVDWDPEF